MEYRRARVPGSSYFFTLVTHNRRSILCESENIELLRNSFRRVKQKHPFVIDAIVISNHSKNAIHQSTCLPVSKSGVSIICSFP